MPSHIIIEIKKDKFNQILTKQDSSENESEKKNSVRLNLEIEVNFSSESELESLRKFIQENKKLEYLKLNLPGSFNFEDVLTEELTKEQVPNLKITIAEKYDSITTTNFNEFM